MSALQTDQIQSAFIKLQGEKNQWRVRAEIAEEQLEKLGAEVEKMAPQMREIQEMATEVIRVYELMLAIAGKNAPENLRTGVLNCIAKLKAIQPKGTP